MYGDLYNPQPSRSPAGGSRKGQALLTMLTGGVETIYVPHIHKISSTEIRAKVRNCTDIYT